MRLRSLAATALGLMVLAASPAFAACDGGGELIKFAHVTNADKHPKASPPSSSPTASTRR